jgi:hypothetical protein
MADRKKLETDGVGFSALQRHAAALAQSRRKIEAGRSAHPSLDVLVFDFRFATSPQMVVPSLKCFYEAMRSLGTRRVRMRRISLPASPNSAKRCKGWLADLVFDLRGESGGMRAARQRLRGARVSSPFRPAPCDLERHGHVDKRGIRCRFASAETACR